MGTNPTRTDPWTALSKISDTRFKQHVLLARFSDPDRSLNRKNERFKVFEIEPRSNRNDVIINLIIN